MTDQQDITRLDQLLMRVLDGEATAEERRELLNLPDSELQLAELRGLSGVLHDAVVAAAGSEPELAGPVLQALGRDDGWTAIGDALRSSVAEPVDVADGVMAAILGEAPAEAPIAAAAQEEASPEAWISALHDGELPVEERLRIAEDLAGDRAALSELSAYAELGRLLKTAVSERSRRVELAPVWGAVAEGIGLEGAEHVPGWEPVSSALRQAITDRAALTPGEQVELADAVMSALPQPKPEPAEINLAPEAPEPERQAAPWWQLWALPAAVMASALLLLFTLFSGTGPGVVEGPGAVANNDREIEEAFELASVNDAELEDFETAEGVMLHVLQAESGGPMILMLEELSDQDDEDAGWDDIEWEEI